MLISFFSFTLLFCPLSTQRQFQISLPLFLTYDTLPTPASWGEHKSPLCLDWQITIMVSHCHADNDKVQHCCYDNHQWVDVCPHSRQILKNDWVVPKPAPRLKMSRQDLACILFPLERINYITQRFIKLSQHTCVYKAGLVLHCSANQLFVLRLTFYPDLKIFTFWTIQSIGQWKFIHFQQKCVKRKTWLTCQCSARVLVGCLWTVGWILLERFHKFYMSSAVQVKVRWKGDYSPSVRPSGEECMINNKYL